MREDIYICDTHKKIKNMASSLKLLRNSEDQSIDEVFLKVEEIANRILELTEEATLSGQSMEDRLLQYRGAIEGLGFQRIK